MIDISVYLSGCEYKNTFGERLKGKKYINQYKLHLLTLHDLFQENIAFQEIVIYLPPFHDVTRVVKEFIFLIFLNSFIYINLFNPKDFIFKTFYFNN